MMTMLFRLTLIAALFLGAACGKKGALVPPDGFAPAPVSGLQVVQQGESFRISWLAPEQDYPVGGARAPAGFRLYRREVRSPADTCSSCGADEILIRTVDLEYLQDAARLGNLIVVADRDVKSGARYQYQVTVFEKNGAEHRDSKRVSRKMVPPPPAPEVRLVEVPAGIMLEWTPVPAGTLLGYNVYRMRPAERSSFRPLNKTPLTEPRYEDLRMEPDLVYRYQVRAVAVSDGETVESNPSPLVEGKFVLP